MTNTGRRGGSPAAPQAEAASSGPGREAPGVEAVAAAGPALESLVERLAGHRTIGAAPRAELAWLVRHGQLRHLAVGDTVGSRSLPVAGMYILLSGRISIHLIRGDTRHKIAEWRAGDVSGLLPYSRLTVPPGDTTVDEPSDALLVPREHLDAMARECHEVTSILVHVMLDRARFFNSSQLHDEKLKSIGKLAAGLAHELNNPAAAITRFAKVLPDALAAAESEARAVGAEGHLLQRAAPGAVADRGGGTRRRDRRLAVGPRDGRRPRGAPGAVAVDR
jgi:signal transduction histidine kinase